MARPDPALLNPARYPFAHTVTTRFADVDPNAGNGLEMQAIAAEFNLAETTFVLPPESVDRLRAAAAEAIRQSPDFQRLLSDVGASIIEMPKAPVAAPVTAAAPK